jgi:hypothetical protein
MFTYIFLSYHVRFSDHAGTPVHCMSELLCLLMTVHICTILVLGARVADDFLVSLNIRRMHLGRSVCW